jgi:hypothetical protein
MESLRYPHSRALYNIMTKFNLNIENKASREKETVAVEFTANEMSELEEYLSNAQKLTELKIVKSGLNTSFKVSASQQDGIRIKTSAPEEEELMAFLHLMRRFILHKEAASYNRITALIKRRIENDQIRSMVKLQRKIYEGKKLQELVKISFNEGLLNSESKLLEWLNAFEYHNDREKIKNMESLLKSISLEDAKVIFISILTEKVKAIINIANFICLLFGRTDSFEATV